MSEITEGRWQEILEQGKGFVFNDFSSKNDSGSQFNVLHRASCIHLKSANLAVRKEYFETAEAALEWLNMFRKSNWKACGACCKDISRIGSRPADKGNPSNVENRDKKDLEQVFRQAMLDIYSRAKKECRYTATYLLQMVTERGGLEAAQSLLHTEAPSDGFTTLWEHQRLDLSVEYHVLMPQFAALFTDEERAVARKRLEQYGFTAFPDKQ